MAVLFAQNFRLKNINFYSMSRYDLAVVVCQMLCCLSGHLLHTKHSIPHAVEQQLSCKFAGPCIGFTLVPPVNYIRYASAKLLLYNTHIAVIASFI